VNIRTFARLFGIVFLVVGIAGFIPGITQPHDHPELAVEAGSGMELGLFPVNVLHNLIHIAFGIWGLLAARSFNGARGYAKSVAIIYAVLTILGLIPATNTTFGLVPIYGHDVWLHALLAAVAAYFGFVHRETERRSGADQVAGASGR
jgi:amino acid transporter